MIIRREVLDFMSDYFSSDLNRGLILGGVVGCGKTTVVKEFIRNSSKNNKIPIFEFNGDDTVFRSALLNDSKYILNHIKSKTSGPCFIFVDEIQKTAECFDAIKYAYDHHPISFIVSGSNPDFLNTTAKKRLQRRADYLSLYPLSLPEILLHKQLLDKDWTKIFYSILFENNKIDLPKYKWMLTPEIQKEVLNYLSFGGLPRCYLSQKINNKLIEIRQVVERGFESISSNNGNISDLITVELAKLHAKEFTYQGIFQRSGLRRREIINTTIDQLINHGYVVKKKPLFIDIDRNSYFSSYSWIDPGIVSYLTGEYDNIDSTIGNRLEGIIATRLKYYQNLNPLKSELGYFKPYSLDINNNVKFLSGEIDFIFKCGRRIVPIEVKSTDHLSKIKIELLENFVSVHKLPYGIVIYGGIPYWEKKKSILFWPYWLC